MSTSDKRFELIKTMKQRQDKFVYYMLGLNVAAIGFSVSKTFDEKLNNNHLYLGFALLCWLISIICTMRWIYLQIAFMEYNLELSDLYEGNYDKNSGRKEKQISEIQTKMMKGIKVIDLNFQGLIYTFVVGVVDFIIWRIIEMW